MKTTYSGYSTDNSTSSIVLCSRASLSIRKLMQKMIIPAIPLKNRTIFNCFLVNKKIAKRTTPEKKKCTRFNSLSGSGYFNEGKRFTLKLTNTVIQKKINRFFIIQLPPFPLYLICHEILGQYIKYTDDNKHLHCR